LICRESLKTKFYVFQSRHHSSWSDDFSVACSQKTFASKKTIAKTFAAENAFAGTELAAFATA